MDLSPKAEEIKAKINKQGVIKLNILPLKNQKDNLWGLSVVRNPCFQCRGHKLDPWQGTKIPHAMQYRRRRRKKKTTFGMGENFCNVTNKGLYISNIQKQLIQLSIKENK